MGGRASERWKTCRATCTLQRQELPLSRLRPLTVPLIPDQLDEQAALFRKGLVEVRVPWVGIVCIHGFVVCKRQASAHARESGQVAEHGVFLGGRIACVAKAADAHTCRHVRARPCAGAVIVSNSAAVAGQTRGRLFEAFGSTFATGHRPLDNRQWRGCAGVRKRERVSPSTAAWAAFV